MGWALSTHSIITSGQELALARLTLSDALREGRLEEFVEAAERRADELGFVPPDERDFDEALEAIVKKPRPEDRT